MHITLTGNLGSGKSTICKILKEVYGFEIYSTGTVQRKIAADMGISVLEMNELMCKDHSYDHLIDDTTARISRENPDKNIVFDSRLAWHFVEKSFKVFLSVSIDEAGRRVFGDSSRGQVETYKSLEDCKEQLRARAANEDKRYEEIYGIHYFDFDNYNLILDSSNATPEVLAATIVKLAGEAEGKEESRQALFSPERLGAEAGKSDKALASDRFCYPEEGVIISSNEKDYEVVSGKEIIEKAAAEGFAFVSCKLK
ncbi:MAG: cytidylate kinase family protein [Lachnospiraceae bacterium]